MFPPEESSSFLKKRTKKLLHVWLRPLPEKLGPNSEKFFGSFFQKRTCFSLANNHLDRLWASRYLPSRYNRPIASR